MTRGQVLQQVWHWARILCLDKVFLCRDKVWSRPRVSMSQQNIFLCRDRVSQGEENLCHDRVFLCRDRVWTWIGGFMSRQSILRS